MPIGSIAGGLIGKAGAEAGGQAAYGAAMGGAQMNQNILQDQQKRNRQDLSPYTATGMTALNQIGQLMGWGTLASPGGDTPWQWDGATAEAQQASQREKVMDMARLVATPEFTRLNVPTTFEADPGYAFRKAEGSKALERSALSRGKALSGEQGKALEDFNSGLASQEYANYWNRYTGGTQFNNAASQQEYQNKYGATRNVLEDWMRLAGMGQSSTGQLTGTGSSLAGNIGNAFTSAGISGGQALGAGISQGANALASGIGSGINNAMTLGYMGWGGSNPIFGGRKSSYDPTNGGVV
jgi:hypothetical protein